MLDAKEEKERERRRKRYKFALVKWEVWDKGAWGRKAHDYSIEHKDVLKHYVSNPTILCDDQPEKVLRGMLKLLKEDK